MELQGAVCIVTGGASGIGAAYSAALVEHGAIVYLADIAPGDTLADELTAKGPGSAYYVRTDVADERSVTALVSVVRSAGERVDVLVNNAALFAAVALKPYHQIDVDEWDRVMAVNVRGMFLMCKHVGPIMSAQRRGKIINIGSGTSIKGAPMMLAYGSSKGAVQSLTRTLARELGADGVCVNTLAPGFTLSPTLIEANQTLVGAVQAPTVGSRSLHRDMYPDDLIGSLIFLASDASDFITGQTILVDGGQLNT
jgi:NAD(P)-dependent dehydrogenase (short-subunit alcohol dehydrogenase family)